MTDTPVMSAPPGSSEPAMPTMSSRLGLDDSLTITHIPASTAGAAGKGKLVNGQPAAVGPAPVALSSRRSEKIDLDTVERKGKRPRDPGPRQHAGGVKEAKTFRPTKEEWKNPMAYMRSIAEEGSTYGIIKIVPPDSWAPDFAMDTERFHFKTRKQELNSVEGGTRANLNYIEQLQKFHKQFGHVMRFPCVDKKPLDLYELKKAVQARGGFEKVCERKKWAEVGRALGYSGKIMSSLSTSLKHSFERWLFPYEQWLAGVKPQVQMQIEMERGGPFGTPSPGASPFSPMKRSHPHTPSSLSKESPAMRASHVLQSTLGGRDTQSQPPELHAVPPAGPPRPLPFTPVNGLPYPPANPPHFTSPIPPPPPAFGPITNGMPPHADQRAIHERSASNSFSASTKPLYSGPKSFSSGGSYGSFELKRSFSDMAADDKEQIFASDPRQIKKPKTDPAPTVTGSHMFQHRFPNLAASFKATINGQGSDKCETCGKDDDNSDMIVCESCDNGYHMQCLDPPILERPRLEWHCSRCLVGTGEYGFGEGSIYSLKQFQVKANDFKENYFKGKTAYDPVHERQKDVTEDDVEKEFWRLVTNVNETVEVEYGADIHSTTHGSGFATLERDPRDPMSIDPWNLNVLPLHEESLFKHIKSDISGMTVPWVYVGMCFSTFCWHNEDHYAYSANFQHFGATKTWYGVPGFDAAKFEAAMKARVPDLFESQPDLLDQLTTLLPPEHLMKAGVNVYAVDQRAGEFVVTFPQAYHAGFNHGFNFNEAVNFAPSDWEPFGRAGVERRREFRKQPCFSHDELLFTAAAASNVPIKTAKWLAPALKAVSDRETAVRNLFEQRIQMPDSYRPHDDEEILMKFERQTDTQDLPPDREEEYVCNYCKTYSYLSRFVCENTKKVACLDHIGMVDWNPNGEANNFVLHTRLTTAALAQTGSKIRETADRPDVWVEKFHLATDGVAKPPLKTLKSLVTEGEKIPWHLKELPTLKKFVETCNEWVEEAINFIARKQQNRRKNEKAWRKSSHAKLSDTEDKEREFRKIKNIERLIRRADQLSFDCPEINTLQEKLESVRNYQHRVDQALENLKSNSAEDIVSLLEEGKSYGVDIPQMSELETILEDLQWLEKAKTPAEYATLKGVDALLSDGARLNVPPEHERILFLRQHKHTGEALQMKIQDCLKQETVNLNLLETCAKSTETIPVSEEILAEMDVILREHREAQKRIQDIVNAANNGDRSKRPTYKAMKECRESFVNMKVKPEGFAEFEKLSKRHEDWMRRGKKLFGKANAPLPILLQHLKVVDERNKFCLDTTEKPRAPVEPPSPRSRDPSPGLELMDQTDPNKIYCLCRRPEDGMMMECRICQEWYHSKCLKIARGKYKEDDDFTCPVCDHNVKIPRDAIRPRLDEFISWQSEIHRMPFRSEEEVTINSIVDVAKNFHEAVKPMMEQLLTTAEEVPTLRFYLRKIEGADVLLAEATNFFRQELYRLHPIAPQPPPEVKFSGSTRKPRPTKEQKLMKEHGVQNPEDLPAHLRPRPYTGKVKRVTVEKDKEEMRASTDRQGSPHLHFRQPLTSTAFPQKGKGQKSGKSPASSTPTNTYSGAKAHSNSSGAVASPTRDSPLPFGANGSVASVPHDTAEHSNIDPNLFATDVNFKDMNDGPAEDDHQPPAETQSGNIFDNQGDSTHGMNSNFDSMFADLTNDDDGKDELVPSIDQNLDPSLMSMT